MCRWRTRVCPSSPTVTRRDPTVAGATSTAIASGRSKRNASQAAAIMPAAYQRCLRCSLMNSLPRLQHGNQVEAVDPSPHTQRREERRADHHGQAVGDRRRADYERDPE